MPAPPGWPAAVLPPDADGWTESAVRWLLDQGPAEFRAHEVLRRYPVILARFTARHVEGCLAGARAGYAAARTDLRDAVPPEAMTAALAAYEREGGRLVALQREVALVEEAIRGQRYVPRL